jgi:hypothetical protein
MSIRRLTVGTLVLMTMAGVLAVGTATPAKAAATEVLADWQMNEPAGATVMTDGSGNGIVGAIGSAVQTGAVFDGATAYRWPFVGPNLPPPKPERLVQVADGRLNPGTRDFAITMRFRTTRPFGNMIQKGQSGSTTGMFKWQIPNGVISCQFRGLDTNGTMLSRSVNSGSTPLNDGAWHTVRCERTATRVTMTIDGTTTRTAIGPTGNITNNVPLTIAGKLNCNQVTITCDYFTGDIDFVRIEVSPTAPPPPPPPPGSAIFTDDFSNGFANWTSVTRMTVDSTTGSPAAPSARVQVSGQSAFATKTLPATYSTLCMSLNVNETQLGANVLLRMRTAADGPVSRVALDANGVLRVRSDVSGVLSPPTVALGTGWHAIELCGTVGTAGTWDLYRDGVKVLDQWVANTGTTPIGRVGIGDTAVKTWTANLDQVVVDQAAG